LLSTTTGARSRRKRRRSIAAARQIAASRSIRARPIARSIPGERIITGGAIVQKLGGRPASQCAACRSGTPIHRLPARPSAPAGPRQIKELIQLTLRWTATGARKITSAGSIPSQIARIRSIRAASRPAAGRRQLAERFAISAARPTAPTGPISTGHVAAAGSIHRSGRSRHRGRATKRWPSTASAAAAHPSTSASPSAATTGAHTASASTASSTAAPASATAAAHPATAPEFIGKDKRDCKNRYRRKYDFFHRRTLASIEVG
jgi:hypothetical protein